MKGEPQVIRWYRGLLRLYPRHLRREHGAEMVEVVRRRWQRVRRAAPARRAAFFVRACASALMEAAIAWIEHARGRIGMRAPIGSPRDPGRIRVPRWAGAAGAELRVAVRSLRRAPGFTLGAVLTLALGIGANTAIFSIVEAVLLEPLPYPGAERLLVIRDQPWTPAEILLDLERSADSFDTVAGIYPRRFAVTGGDEPVQVEGAEVTADLLGVLGARIARGRGFTPADTGLHAPPTAIIAHGFWQRHLGGAEDVVGRGIRVNGQLHEIVGVVAPGFRQLTPRTGDAELWVPLRIAPIPPEGSFTGSSATSDWALPVLRLRSDASPSRAQAELDVVMRRFRERHPRTRDNPRWNLRLEPLRAALVRDVRPALVMLQLAVGVLLLLACVNVANLMLVRRSARRQELAVRAALGASRGQLLGHLLAEGLVVALLGGGLAVLLTVLGLDLLVATAPGDVPRIDQVSVDPSVLLVTLGVCLATGVLFALLPVLSTGLRARPEALQAGGRTTAGSAKQRRVSQLLVIAQVTLTLVLLVGAGLLVRSFVALVGQDPGFRAEDVVVAPLRLPEDPYADLSRLEGFYRRVRERIEGIPGVEAVGVANYLPIRRGTASRRYVLEGRSDPEPEGAQYGVVSPGYFRALDIPVRRGRPFRETDRRGSPRVAVIDEAMWQRAWPGEDPVGKRLRFPDEEEWLTVVGVVGDIRGDGLASEPEPGLYISYQQRPRDPAEIAVGRSGVLLVRSRIETRELAATLREAVWDVDPRQPVPRVVALEAVLSEDVGPQRFRAALVGAFAAVALALVVAGIYGVVAYLVAERSHEFGIRVAMGATDGDVVALVLTWGLRLTTAGIAVGLLVVLAVNRHLGGLLFRVTPTDPVTIAGSVAVVLLIATVACLLPVRRAVRLDPVDALRREH